MASRLLPPYAGREFGGWVRVVFPFHLRQAQTRPVRFPDLAGGTWGGVAAPPSIRREGDWRVGAGRVPFSPQTCADPTSPISRPCWRDLGRRRGSSLHTQGGSQRVGAGRDPFSPQANAQPAGAVKRRLKVPPASSRGLSNIALRQQRCDSAVYEVAVNRRTPSHVGVVQLSPISTKNTKTALFPGGNRAVFIPQA